MSRKKNADKRQHYCEREAKRIVLDCFVNNDNVIDPDTREIKKTIQCDGCGKKMLYSDKHTTYKTLNPNSNLFDPKVFIFCPNCIRHIKKTGTIFFNTYSFGY